MGTDAHTTAGALRQAVAGFVNAREWQPFHSPKNLSLYIAIEAARFEAQGGGTITGMGCLYPVGWLPFPRHGFIIGCVLDTAYYKQREGECYDPLCRTPA